MYLDPVSSRKSDPVSSQMSDTGPVSSQKSDPVIFLECRIRVRFLSNVGSGSDSYRMSDPNPVLSNVGSGVFSNIGSGSGFYRIPDPDPVFIE